MAAHGDSAHFVNENEFGTKESELEKDDAVEDEKEEDAVEDDNDADAEDAKDAKAMEAMKKRQLGAAMTVIQDAGRGAEHGHGELPAVPGKRYIILPLLLLSLTMSGASSSRVTPSVRQMPHRRSARGSWQQPQSVMGSISERPRKRLSASTAWSNSNAEPSSSAPAASHTSSEVVKVPWSRGRTAARSWSSWYLWLRRARAASTGKVTTWSRRR